MDSLTKASRGLMRVPLCAGLLVLALACSPMPETESAPELPYDAMAGRIVAALQPEPGERAILGFDPSHMPTLAERTERALRDAGVLVTRHEFGASGSLKTRLREADTYVWLPFGPESDVEPLMAEFPITSNWVDSGFRRQVHFHWNDGTRAPDGMQGVHSPAYDRVYADALDIDYAALDRRMGKAIAALRSGEVRVTTPAGTDLRFETGGRVFTKQNGDASRAAMENARVRIQREMELPAGALRVAPLEQTVQGVFVVPYARLLAHPWARSDGEPPMRNLRLTFRDGVVTEVAAGAGEDLFRDFLEKNPALKHFREFALGFNPKLVTPEGSEWIPYYGYGEGVVRLSLGDNTELGGSVRGAGTRWFLFTDATVSAAGHSLVRDGKLQGF